MGAKLVGRLVTPLQKAQQKAECAGKTRFKFTPCEKCGCTIRYTNGAGCVDCRAANCRKLRAAKPRKRPPYKTQADYEELFAKSPVIHQLTALGPAGRDKRGERLWRFRCVCGKVRRIIPSMVLRGQKKSCGCLKKRMGSENPVWTGGSGISGSKFAHIKGHAKTRGHPFEISVEDIDRLYERQEGRCALSGLEIGFNDTGSGPKKGNTASLDQIVPGKGYVKGNIQLLHKDVNLLKGVFSNKQTRKLAAAIADHTRDVSP